MWIRFGTYEPGAEPCPGVSRIPSIPGIVQWEDRPDSEKVEHLEESLHKQNDAISKVIQHILFSQRDHMKLDENYIFSCLGFIREGEEGFKSRPWDA